MNNRLMRILVFFDLPVKTKAERGAATKFRNFLLMDGYHMIQLSVYARICNGTDSVAAHKLRLASAVPSKGSVRMLVITEKQYSNIQILLGKPTVRSEERRVGKECRSRWSDAVLKIETTFEKENEKSRKNMRFIFGKHMFFLLILAKSLENAHGLLAI